MIMDGRVSEKKCEFCYKPKTSERIYQDRSVSVCKHHTEGYLFSGVVTRTQYEALNEILQDPIAAYLLRQEQRSSCSGSYKVLRDCGDPRNWPEYSELADAGFVPPAEPPRPQVAGTHEHWHVSQNHWTGEWCLQRGVRNGLGTSYDPPLPEHKGFKTRKEAEEVKRKLRYV